MTNVSRRVENVALGNVTTTQKVNIVEITRLLDIFRILYVSQRKCFTLQLQNMYYLAIDSYFG